LRPLKKEAGETDESLLLKKMSLEAKVNSVTLSKSNLTVQNQMVTQTSETFSKKEDWIQWVLI
jgi:hypothetical protein